MTKGAIFYTLQKTPAAQNFSAGIDEVIEQITTGEMETLIQMLYFMLFCMIAFFCFSNKNLT